MALDLKNNNPNSKSSALGSKPTGSPAASSTSVGAQIEVTKPSQPDPPSQFELRPPRFWLVLAILVMAVAVGLIILYLKIGAKKQTPNKAAEQQQVALSSPISHETPKPPPAIANQDDKKALNDYFTNVSTNFKPEYMEKIPQVAFDGFKKYQAANGDEKLDAARTFYIYLNSPGLAGDDPIYPEFVKDILNDLEKTLGKKLF